MSTCSCCGGSCQAHRLIACCVCERKYNIECVDVSAAEARKINSKSGLFWSCTGCSSVVTELNSLRSIVLRLEKEIVSLKSSVLAPVQSVPSLIDTEKIVQEVSERERRKCNIVMFGCVEDVVPSKSARSEADSELVSSILGDLSIEHRPVCEPVRLGRFDATRTDRPRPIKLQFSSERAVGDIVRKSAKLRSIERWSSIFMSRDRTPMQNELYKSAKTQLTERVRAGETNLRIRFKGGIPTVVVENPQDPQEEN